MRPPASKRSARPEVKWPVALPAWAVKMILPSASARIVRREDLAPRRSMLKRGSVLAPPQRHTASPANRTLSSKR